MLKIKPRTVLRSRTGTGGKKVLLGGVVFIFALTISFSALIFTNNNHGHHGSGINSGGYFSSIRYPIQSVKATDVDWGKKVDDSYTCPCKKEESIGSKLKHWLIPITQLEKLMPDFAVIICQIICYVGKLAFDATIWILNFIPVAPL